MSVSSGKKHRFGGLDTLAHSLPSPFYPIYHFVSAFIRRQLAVSIRLPPYAQWCRKSCFAIAIYINRDREKISRDHDIFEINTKTPPKPSVKHNNSSNNVTNMLFSVASSRRDSVGAHRQTQNVHEILANLGRGGNRYELARGTGMSVLWVEHAACTSRTS